MFILQYDIMEWITRKAGAADTWHSGDNEVERRIAGQAPSSGPQTVFMHRGTSSRVSANVHDHCSGKRIKLLVNIFASGDPRKIISFGVYLSAQCVQFKCERPMTSSLWTTPLHLFTAIFLP